MVILVVICHLKGCTMRLYYPKPRVDIDNDQNSVYIIPIINNDTCYSSCFSFTFAKRY